MKTPISVVCRGNPACSRARVQIMNVPFDPISEPEAIERILSSIAGGRGGSVVTPNLDIVRQVTHEPSLLAFIESADLSLADGTTVVWASHLQGTPLPERVTGSSLIFTLNEAAAAARVPVFLLGGAPKTAEGAALRLEERYSGLRVVGTHCPPFSDFAEGSAELDEICARLRESRPRIVFVGLGFPKQEQLIAKLRLVLPEAWFLGVGMALGFASGEVSRAPRWMQVVGLEWFHRLIQEPRRLFRRFVILGIPFSLRLFANALHTRISGTTAPPRELVREPATGLVPAPRSAAARSARPSARGLVRGRSAIGSVPAARLPSPS
jgi:N-acetylglucosaminyldiphosphoundecaprenol N-acetyl-beta-D-mannosaminyltransferase